MSEALDLSMLKGTPEQRETICAELLKTLKTRGGVKLKNHGISDELIDQLFDYVSSTAFELVGLRAHNSTDSQVLRSVPRGEDDSGTSPRGKSKPGIQLRGTRISLHPHWV